MSRMTRFFDPLTFPMKTLLTGLFTIAIVAFSPAFLDPMTAFKLQSEGKATLIDVREADEIELGMVKDALWFPLSVVREKGEAQESYLRRLSKDKLIIVYCRSGQRAEIFASILRDKGYNVENMGAFANWKKASLPIVVQKK
jgi:rhodanese-related sulfurtransferase